MARDRDPIVKQSRREGYALHPKAQRIMIKRSTPPGQHSHARQGKKSQYSLQLREKQKVRRLYGLLEKQFAKAMKEAGRQEGQAGENLIINLERRLDNTVFRAGFAISRRAARQLVGHGHFMLNGKRVDIPSILVNPGDEIELRPKSIKNAYFTNYEEIADLVDNTPRSWLKADSKKFKIKVTGTPKREEADPDINEQLIVEYYSR
jgi:small subunit ribosomal protein S4